MQRNLLTAVAFALTIALSACGGGGGGGSPSAGASVGTTAGGTGSGSTGDTGGSGTAGGTGTTTGSTGGTSGTGGTGTTSATNGGTGSDSTAGVGGSGATTAGTGTTTGITGGSTSGSTTNTGTATTGTTTGSVADSGGTTTPGTVNAGGTGTALPGAATSPDTGPGYASASGTGPKTLVLFDAPANSEWQKLGLSYAIMLRNLLGHFDAAVDLVPVQKYTAGRMAGYDATFYIGAAYDNALPAAFVADAAASTKTLVWFKYNLWQLTGNAALDFGNAHGFTLNGLRGLNAVPSATNPTPGFFDTVSYKGRQFVKYYAWDGARNQVNADPDVGITAITDPAKAQALVTMTNPKTGEQAPYVLRSGRFWYVADMPFSYIGPRDRYLVIADLLHDMLDVQHAESHKAMVRLEDVDAKVSVSAMKGLTDYLYGKGIPFSIALIPHYKDPNGIANDGVAQDIPLAQATGLRQAVDYALARGAEVVMHGYTHQYGTMKNPWTGISGDDYEFWDIVNNAPVPEDSTAWALGRLSAGLGELGGAGYRPVAWETPHYFCSALACKAVPQLFSTTYQRVVYLTADKPDFAPRAGKDFAAGQIFPYVIQRDYYNQRVLPENLGNIEYDISKVDPSSYYTYSWQEIYLNAQYALTVRDGFGSFFFHPFWAEAGMNTPGMADFKKLVDSISALGYTWTAPSAVR
jgi:uncharacterized protein YdaL